MEDLFSNANPSIQRVCRVQTDSITDEISKAFDYEYKGEIETTIDRPIFPTDFQIGVIVGSSGSGKSTILKSEWGGEETVNWDNTKCIASHFKSAEEASQKFGAVGLNSIPTWLKTYNVLSTGEKFRADMARRLHDNACIDEFTSVVNREVAISCSMSISKYIRNNNIKNVVFCSCHDDIIPYLAPDWVYNTDTHEFYNGRYLQRSQIAIKFSRCKSSVWSLFKNYHYLSSDLNEASVCYLGTYNDRPVVFMALLTLPGRDVEHAWREHRLVVLPDFQGMGIGNKTSEMFGQAYIEKGCQYFCKTANPRIGEHRDHSPLWKPTSNNHKSRESYLNTDGSLRDWNPRYGMKQELVALHSHRVCYSHEYIGNSEKYPYTLETVSTIENTESPDQLFLFV